MEKRQQVLDLMQVIVWQIEYAICIDDDDSWDRESQSVLGGEDALTAVMAVRESILGRKISGTLDSDFAGGPEEEFEYKLTDFKLLGVKKVVEIDHVVTVPPAGILADQDEQNG